MEIAGRRMTAEMMAERRMVIREMIASTEVVSIVFSVLFRDRAPYEGTPQERKGSASGVSSAP
jgi:hypothetical protein